MVETPRVTGDLAFKSGHSMRCEPRSDEERTRNISIADRVKSIMEKRLVGSLTSHAIVFLTADLPDTGIGIERYSKRKEYSEIVPEKFSFPLYRIATNSFGTHFRNTKNGLVYRVDAMYYFSNKGQAVNHILIDKDPKGSIVKELDMNQEFERLANGVAGKISIFGHLNEKNYVFIEKWLKVIESGKCREIQYPMKQKIPQATK